MVCTCCQPAEGHDWCIIQLGVPGLIYGFDVDSSFFTGNHSPHVSIQAACLDDPPTLTLEGDRTGMAASDSQLAAVAKLSSETWPELLCVSELNPGYNDSCHNYFHVNFNHRVTHLRLNMFPANQNDDGVFRWRDSQTQSVWHRAERLVVCPYQPGHRLGGSDQRRSLPGLQRRPLWTSTQHDWYNTLGLGRASSMADGWETARRLDRPKELEADERGILQVPGWEWAVFRLGHPGVISSIEVDTNHFKGNFPDSCRIEACTLTPEEEAESIRSRWNSGTWRVLLPPQKLGPHNRRHFSEAELTQSGAVTHVRLVIAPDGGVSRLRLWGPPMPTSTRTAKQPATQSPKSKL
ncbi:allantoicase isoform X3 [Genypterus blacodes]|uniref:allantoicase isoform X3 n=1 Tax=Genypterus blacodes TaxID=154954 RepID=UPI003F75FFF6